VAHGGGGKYPFNPPEITPGPESTLIDLWNIDFEFVTYVTEYQVTSTAGIFTASIVPAAGLPDANSTLYLIVAFKIASLGPPLPAPVVAVTDLPRDDAWSLDNLQSDWEQTQGNPPEEYTESISPVEQIYLAYPPADVGAIDLLYVAVGTALSNSGVPLTVPDIGVSGVTWRALRYLLAKVGEAEDVNRAEYCDVRYQESIQMAKSMLGMPYRIAAEG